MPNWNPSANLLVLIIGSKEGTGSDFPFHLNYSAFQGAIWSTHDCNIDDGAMSSGPVICNKILVGNTGGGFYTWPPITYSFS